jgi:hypothetical protein
MLALKARPCSIMGERAKWPSEFNLQRPSLLSCCHTLLFCFARAWVCVYVEQTQVKIYILIHSFLLVVNWFKNKVERGNIELITLLYQGYEKIDISLELGSSLILFLGNTGISGQFVRVLYNQKNR